MEECQPITNGETTSEVMEKTQTQKPVDPSSVSIVYGWMFSVLTSIYRSISIEKERKAEIIEDKENTFINNLASINLNQKTNKNIFTKNNTIENHEGNVEMINKNGLATNPMDIFSIYSQNLEIPPLKKTLILDLDETLVHSTLTPVSHHHLTVNVSVEDVECTFYVIKRPHVDYFLARVAEWYNVVVFTASMKEYADPLLNKLDQNRLIKQRLFRDSCLERDGNFIKDLGMIEQELSTTIIVDNSPIAYSNNIENALPIDNWMGDNPSDESLLTLLPFLEVLRYVNDVRSILSLRLTGGN